VNDPVFVLRPEPGLTTTLVAAFERGIKARGMPLGTVVPVSWSAPATKFDGLLIGSANAIRHAGRELDKVAHLPVFAVGEATAHAARDLGLQIGLVGEGGLQGLIDALPPTDRHLLRLAGEEHIWLEPASKTQITTEIVYAAKYSSLSKKQASVLNEGALVILHSGAMATHFAEQCEQLGVDRSQITLAAMAPRIADMAGNGWKAVHIAKAKNDAALLDLAEKLCHS